MDTATFNTFLVVMAVTALIVFIALHFINAGYGMLFDKYRSFHDDPAYAIGK